MMDNDKQYGLQPSQSQPQGSVSIRVVGSGDVARMNASDLLPRSEQEAGILATARNQVGGPASRLTDNSIVKYQGMEVDLRTAATLGLVTRNADGSYSERGTVQGPQEKPTPTQPPIDTSVQQQQQGDEPVPFDDAAVEGAFAALSAEIPEGLQDGLVSAFIGNAVNGADVDHAISQAANAAGMDSGRLFSPPLIALWILSSQGCGTLVANRLRRRSTSY